MATIVHDSAAVRQALASGQLTVVDPETGYHRGLYADCPAGHPAAVWRIVREHGAAITAVTVRCAYCGVEFIAPTETLYLK